MFPGELISRTDTTRDTGKKGRQGAPDAAQDRRQEESKPLRRGATLLKPTGLRNDKFNPW